MKDLALVLGGTGHVGNAIVRALCARGWRVRVLSRRSTRPLNLQGLDVEFQQVRWSFAQSLDKWLFDCDLLIDAAGPYSTDSSFSHSTERRRHLEDAEVRTQRIIESIAKRNIPLGYISSFTTGPDEKTAAPYFDAMRRASRALHPYFDIKESIEQSLIQAAQQGQRITIVNPTLCLGPWESRPEALCFIPSIARGNVPIVANHVVNTIDVRDVAEALLRAVERDIIGEPILLSGHHQTWLELHQTITSIHGTKSTAIPIPLEALWATGHFTEALFRAFGAKSPMPSLVSALVAEHRHRTPLPLQRSLNLTLRPTRSTIVDALNWYQKLNYL